MRFRILIVSLRQKLVTVNECENFKDYKKHYHKNDTIGISEQHFDRFART